MCPVNTRHVKAQVATQIVKSDHGYAGRRLTMQPRNREIANKLRFSSVVDEPTSGTTHRTDMLDEEAVRCRDEKRDRTTVRLAVATMWGS
jgi:hypothetical protein